MRNTWKFFFAAAALAGCGTVAVQEGGGAGTPTPSPSGSLTPTPTPVPIASLPSQAMFDSNVQPILDLVQCGNAGCHMPPSGGGGVNLVTKPGTAVPTAADMIANLKEVSCVGPLDSFQPAAGSFLTFFCTNATTPATMTSHAPGRTTMHSITTNDCTAMFNWVASGGTGNLPTCN